MREIVVLAGPDDDLHEIFTQLEDRLDGGGRLREPRGVMVHAILDLRQDPRAIHRRLFGRDPDGPANTPEP